MEENKNIQTLTDEDVELIAKELGDGASETTKHLREIMAEGENDDKDYGYNVLNKKVGKVLANVEIDPNTGEKRILNVVDEVKDNGISVEDIAYGDDIKKLSEISQDKMKESLVGMDMSDEEALQVIDILRRYEDGETIKYEELPKFIAQMVDSLRGTSGENGVKLTTKTIINDVLHLLKNQLQMDNEIIEFQEVLQKELKIPEMINMYNKETDALMYDKLYELAEAREQEEPEKAQELRNIADNYKDAKTYKTIKELVDTNAKVTRKLDREVKRFKQYIRDFHYKYEKNTRFKIDSLELVLKVLVRHTKLSEEQCIKFLIMFCRIALNMTPNNVADHTYMYYTLKTITMLDAFGNTEDEYYLSVVNTLTDIITKL